eukprot:TRINITY_DN5073_c0_g1_i2.p1 TRINITY_DN5073_c0_g1~~TRINITY_DN5073_c0_g1_i2.p1  ORF type:complete len:1105 (-),score=246.34 TRINITY_DN5073_c0_g1_i2:820-4134(-)
MNKLRKASYLIIGSMETVFYKWGEIVAKYPWRIILTSFLITALSAFGLFYLRIEQQANELWIPPWSTFNTHLDWLKNNFQSKQRDELLLFESSDNILTPEAIQKMYQVYKRISEIEVNGKTFDNMCFKVPVGNIFHTERRRRRRRRRRDADPVQIGAKIDAALNKNGSSLLDYGDGFLTSSVESQFLEADNSSEVFSITNSSNSTGILDTDTNEFDEESTTTENIEDSDEEFFWNDYEDYDYYDYAYEETSPSSVTVDSNKPRIDFEVFGKQVDGEEDEYDYEDEYDDGEEGKPLEELPIDVKCGITNTLREKCLMTNILEIWGLKEDLIMTTTQQEIIDAINLLERSPWSSHKVNFTEQLGGVVRNSSGHVVYARAALMYWNVEVPDDVELITSVGGGVEITFADKDTLEWESRFVEAALSFDFPGYNIFPNAVRSFGDLNEQAILFDVLKLVIGYIIMFVYTVFMLGRINKLELRLYMTIVGIVSVGMGLVIGIGISSLIGYPYTPIHSALPFLCLGIGIDDMFVIVQCWYNMRKHEADDVPLPRALGITLRHAGVSVTITTLTDVFAFAVGAITIMPGLESFCVCTAIALGSIYFLQITWFAAFLALDERRIRSKRNSIVPCIIHKDYNVTPVNSIVKAPWIIRKYSKILASKVYRFSVIILSVGVVCVAAWGASMIKQKFDPNLLLPLDTYLRRYLEIGEDLFPENGWDTQVYTGHIDSSQLHSIDKLYEGIHQLKKERVYIRNYDGFWDGLKEYAFDVKKYKSIDDFAHEDVFPMLLSDFLFSSDGGKYKKDFLFNGTLECGYPAPPITATKFKVNLKVLKGPSEHIPARRAIETIINSTAVSDVAFSHVKIYAAWETDEIIGFELMRNVGLALVVISIITLILLTDIKICSMAFACVLFTLTDIVGFLHFWHMTIDIISCVSIVLAIGLCVDYSVHVGHAYLIAPGNRLEKSISALETIGPAVFNGGFTTLLAVIVMAFSKSSVFLTFFKVFFLTVTFGLFHGLVFLPVVLSLAGPLGGPDEEGSESGGSGNSETTSATSSGPSTPPTSSSLPSVIGQGQQNMAYITEMEGKETESWRPRLIKVMSKKTGSMDLGPAP